MNKMTQAQKDYINKVILPTLVQMAIDGTLDSDMNVLGYHDFEKATEEYNGSETKPIKVIVNVSGGLVNGARATDANINLTVFDEDDKEAEGISKEDISKQWETEVSDEYPYGIRTNLH